MNSPIPVRNEFIYSNKGSYHELARHDRQFDFSAFHFGDACEIGSIAGLSLKLRTALSDDGESRFLVEVNAGEHHLGKIYALNLPSLLTLLRELQIRPITTAEAPPTDDR